MGSFDLGKLADYLEKESQRTISRELNAFKNGVNETEKPKHIKTINENMEGSSIAGVPYRKQIIRVNGEKYEGVFPRFEAKYQMKLPQSLYRASDDEQMKYCTQRLKLAIERNPDLARNFTARQLEQIKDGNARISGLTWHHNERPGIMQLVDANAHSAARHTGGRSIWGGGGDYR